MQPIQKVNRIGFFIWVYGHNILMNKKKNVKTMFLGLICGLINGFFGSGGGIVAVQSMEKIGIRDKNAHATSLFVILPLSIVSGAVYLMSGNITFNGDTIMLLIGGAVGGVLGALLLNKVKREWVNMIFTLLILASGIRMVF